MLVTRLPVLLDSEKKSLQVPYKQGNRVQSRVHAKRQGTWQLSGGLGATIMYSVQLADRGLGAKQPTPTAAPFAYFSECGVHAL